MPSIRHAVAAVLTLTLLLSFPGCGQASDDGTAPANGAAAIASTQIDIPETPDGTILAVATALADGQPRALWDAMPASYQSDVTGLIGEFAEKMDEDLYNKSADVTRKAVNLLKTKKDLFLQMQGGPVGGMFMMTDKQVLTDNWDGLTDLLDTLASSEVSTLQGLKGVDVGTFLGGTGAQVMSKTQALMKAVNPADANELDKLRELEVEVLESTDDTATVRVTSGDETDEMTLTRVDGRWVPDDMAEQWDAQIAEARQNLADMVDDPDFEQNKAQTMTMLENVDAALDQLGQAETVEQLQQGIGGLMQVLMSGGM